ncbi:MAG: NAD-dependent epimerase/dehydratase family protein [Vicinamibacterales bacterium]|nr:NAD-dependent epimerase/dehydratase family protein [Vicinamibacterales bacterium]
MRIFLTGATGYIGSAVLDALLRGNHQVTALVRTPQAKDALLARGVAPVLGDLTTPKSYRACADGFDAYVHTAADVGVKREGVDAKAIDTLLSAAASHAARTGTGAFVYTSGVWVLGSNAQPMTESAQPNPGQLLGWRPVHEQLVLKAAGNGLRTSVIRPGIVYGGSRGIVSDLLKNALNGLIRVIGTGDNHWPLVYDRDLADLYVRAATRPEALGIYHANDEADETVNAVVEGIVNHLSAPPDVRHVPLEEARKKVGAYADALALDQIVRGPRARELGWSPTLHSVSANVPRLLEEFRSGQERAA